MIKASVEDAITALVEDNWASEKKPMLLSRVGAQLNRQFRESLQNVLLGAKLKEFIQHRVKAVRIIKHPSNSIVWGLVPASVIESAEVLFGNSNPAAPQQEAHQETPTTDHQLIRYDRTLWQAFYYPISPAVDRYLKVDEQVRMFEFAQNSPGAPEGAIKLGPSDVTNADDPSGTAFSNVSAKIEAWATRHRVDISRFKKITAHRSINKSLLDLMLETISEDDLRQVSMPLNVIKSLAAKKP